MDENKVIDPTLETNPTDPETEFKKKEEEEEKKEEEKKENPFPPKKDEEGKDDEEKPADSDKEEKGEEDEDEKKKKAAGKHSLTDEEVADSDLYKTLAVQFAQLQKDFEALKAEVEPLRSFKVETDRKAKQEMIDSFYMLSDAEKKDCVDNIDTYSLDDIEAKLSVICVRNKVSFDLDNDKKEPEKTPENPLVYELDGNDGDSAPAWIKAVRETAKEMN